MTDRSYPEIRLYYFDFHGGRGEASRIALSIAGVPFEDHRIQFKDWAELKPTMPFLSVPVLEVDGKRLSQSNAINRWVGKLTRLYPEDPWQAALSDQAGDAVEALYAEMLGSTQMTDKDEQKAARDKALENGIPRYMRAIERLLEEAGGEWFADGRLTIGDLKVAECVRYFSTGILDFIPKDVVQRIAPQLAEHRQRVLAHPDVKAYYDRVGA